MAQEAIKGNWMKLRIHFDGIRPVKVTAPDLGWKQVNNVESVGVNITPAGPPTARLRLKFGPKRWPVGSGLTVTQIESKEEVVGEVLKFGWDHLDLVAPVQDVGDEDGNCGGPSIFIGAIMRPPAVDSQGRVWIPPWFKVVELFPRDNDRWWARFTGTDGLYRWLHPTENRWVEEPEQKGMPLFPNWAAARRAVLASPPPPTWVNSPASVGAAGGPETKEGAD